MLPSRFRISSLKSCAVLSLACSSAVRLSMALRRVSSSVGKWSPPWEDEGDDDDDDVDDDDDDGDGDERNTEESEAGEEAAVAVAVEVAAVEAASLAFLLSASRFAYHSFPRKIGPWSSGCTHVLKAAGRW